MQLRHEVVFITKDDIVSQAMSVSDKPTLYIFRACKVPFGVFYTEDAEFNSAPATGQGDGRLEVRRYVRRGYSTRVERIDDFNSIEVITWKMLEDA